MTRCHKRQERGPGWEATLPMTILARDLRRIFGAAAIFAALAFAGCASNKLDTASLNPDPPTKMFADADAMMSKGNLLGRCEAVRKRRPRPSLFAGGSQIHRDGRVRLLPRRQVTGSHCLGRTLCGLASGNERGAARLSHHRVGLLRRYENSQSRSDAGAQSARSAKDAEDALS